VVANPVLHFMPVQPQRLGGNGRGGRGKGRLLAIIAVIAPSGISSALEPRAIAKQQHNEQDHHD
jgi:hypothetical protein